MRTRTDPFHEPTEEEIQHAAYFLWIEQGRPKDCELENWFAARERLRHHSGRTPQHGRRAAPVSVVIQPFPQKSTNN